MTEKDIAPDCPICGSKMIERTAKRGARKGKIFGDAQSGAKQSVEELLIFLMK